MPKGRLFRIMIMNERQWNETWSFFGAALTLRWITLVCYRMRLVSLKGIDLWKFSKSGDGVDSKSFKPDNASNKPFSSVVDRFKLFLYICWLHDGSKDLVGYELQILLDYFYHFTTAGCPVLHLGNFGMPSVFSSCASTTCGQKRV